MPTQKLQGKSWNTFEFTLFIANLQYILRQHNTLELMFNLLEPELFFFNFRTLFI